MDLIDLTVASRFLVLHKIGKGSFGQVFLGRDLNSSTEVAIKVEAANGPRQFLLYEAKIMKNLESIPGVPHVLWSGMQDNYSFMVMDLLGVNLSKKFETCGKKLGVKDWVSIGLQVVDRLQDVHNCCYLHRDIKPENFTLGLGTTKHQIYIIDFGLSKKYCDPKTMQHIPYRENKNLTGTARYASVNSHVGLEQSRRDDLESMFYLLIYLLKGELPWQSINARNKTEKYSKIMEKKAGTTVEDLCKNLPLEMTEMLRYVKGLRFEEEPDYDFLREGLVRIAEANKIKIDGVLDWKVPHPSLHPPNRRKSHSSHRSHRKSILSVASMISSNPLASSPSQLHASDEETQIGDLPTITLKVRTAARPVLRSRSLQVREKK